jgi:hypothetical protein
MWLEFALAAWSWPPRDKRGSNQEFATGDSSVSDFGQRRRGVLKGVLALSVGLPLLEARAATEDDPKKSRPQVGDVLVFDRGDRKDQPPGRGCSARRSSGRRLRDGAHNRRGSSWVEAQPDRAGAPGPGLLQRRDPGALEPHLGWRTDVPQGGVVWVFALEQ